MLPDEVVPAEALFDRGRPVSVDPAPPEKLKDFADVLRIVPDPYAREVERAYVVMIDFATRCWPAAKRIVDIEPAFEWLMHADIFNPKYRDHIVHQTRVAAIGDLLLRQEVHHGTLLERATEALKDDLKGVTGEPGEFVRLAWWLAALFHDCGQAYEFHNAPYKTLKKVYSVPLASATSCDWSKCHDHVAKVLGGLSGRDIENCRKGRHCFLGAAELLMQLREYEKEIGDGESPEYGDRRRALFRLAARAIIRHHYPAGNREQGEKIEEDEKIRFEENPLGFLLILSDEIDDAKRPRGDPKAKHGVREGKTVCAYVEPPIKHITASTDGSSSPTLTLTVNLRPNARKKRLDGKSPTEWCQAKEEKLKASLRFGPGELFRDVKVEPHPKATATP